MSVTIKDVARLAKVSISTVSRVINDSKPVSDETKQRVLKVIEETGYTPNNVARSLVMKKSQLIGVIVPDISNSFTSEILNGVEEIGKMYNYDILLCNSYNNQDQEIKYLKLLKSKQVEGIIFMTNKFNEKHKKFLKNNNLPVVTINRNPGSIDIPTICIDHFKAAYDMTSYLIKNGHTKIALVRSGAENDAFGVDQYKGYVKALEEHGIEVNPHLVKEGELSMEKAYKSVQSLIDEGHDFTAIFATTDQMAIAAINCLIDNGYKVPDDITVVGSNDIKWASIYRPRLTTIRQPIYDIGAVAIRLIIKIAKGEKIDEKKIILPHELIVRESSKSLL